MGCWLCRPLQQGDSRSCWGWGAGQPSCALLAVIDNCRIAAGWSPPLLAPLPRWPRITATAPLGRLELPFRYIRDPGQQPAPRSHGPALQAGRRERRWPGGGRGLSCAGGRGQAHAQPS